MVELALKPLDLGGINEIPVAAGAAVVAPVRYGGIVAENRMQCHIGLAFVTEIFHPRINFFLACRVPGHFAAEWISLFFPAGGARAHLCFQAVRFGVHTLTSEIFEDFDKD